MCLPAVGQGALAIEARIGDQEVIDRIGFLRDEDTVQCALAERAFLGAVEGGCQVPVGVYAVCNETGGLNVEAVIASIDGQRLLRDCVIGKKQDAVSLGKLLAEKLLAAGGLAIMQEIGLLTDR
jgi:hydroxymethylbilane synthase